MHRTVHVRTVFPSGSGPCRTVVHSRSGQGADARSVFFVLRASDAAARAPALAAALLDTDERDPTAVAALADAALPGPVADRDLALLVVAPPVGIGYVVGRGVLAIVTEGTVRMSEPGFAGAGTLGMERVRAGHAWRDTARVGDGFVLGLTDHLARLSAVEIATLPAWLDRSARSHPLERVLSDLSRQDGALIVGRVHHVTAAAPAVPRPRPRSTTRRASLRYALALVAAALAFVALVEAGASGRSTPAPDHTLTPRWSRAVRDPGPGRPVWMGDVLALTRAGPRPTLDLLDPFSGTTLRSWPLPVSDPGQPIRAGACLVVAGNAGPAVAVDVESGATRWTVTLPGPVDAFATMEDRLWIASGNRLLALDARSGRIRFDTPLPGPLVGLDVTQGIGVAVSATGDVSAFEPSGGRSLWHIDGKGEPAFGPHIVRGRVYVAEAGGHVSCYHVYRGHRQWTADLGVPLVTPPARWGDVLFVGTADGRVAAVDRQDGGILWRSARRNHRPLSLVVENDDVYVIEEHAIVPLDAHSGEHGPALRHDGVWEWALRANGLWIGGNRTGDIDAVSPGSLASDVMDEQAG